MTEFHLPLRTDCHDRPSAATDGVVVELSAVLVAVGDDRPQALIRGDRQTAAALPAGPFEPAAHRTLELGLRSWVREQTGVSLGYVEQLYTFGDRGRHPREAREGSRVISVGYLALTRDRRSNRPDESHWQDWYRFFPWEDWRATRPDVIDRIILPGLSSWIDSGNPASERRSRRDRARLCFGFDGLAWDPEKVLERYELLYEAGLVPEWRRDRLDQGNEAGPDGCSPAGDAVSPAPDLGNPMFADHRRILATAISRLRGKLKYRPVVFELMPPAFTLLQLQRTVEAIGGLRLHKQNFRRLVEKSGLVEGTGRIVTGTGGRPAEEFRFRPDVVRERPAPGVHLPAPRSHR